MANITREDHDKLNTTITLTLGKDDYEPKYKQELQKYRKQASLKGFRKGKTPIGVLKKMYGRAILSDIINEKIQEEIGKFIEENDLDILGQPLESKDQERIELDPHSTQDYVFTFDLGLAPEFDINGLSESDSYEVYKIEVPDEEVDEQIDQLRRQGGQTEEADTLEMGDTFVAKLEELNEEGEMKKDGITSETTLMVDNIDEEIRDQLVGAKLGDTVNASVYQLEDNVTESHARKYLLEIDEDADFGENYALTIQKVNRLVPAELNQEFFDQVFGPDKVSTEEEARAEIKKQWSANLDAQADVLLFEQMIEELVEKNELEIPEEFLKRWLHDSNPNNTLENIEKGFESFERSLRWTMISNKVQKEDELEVKPEEIQKAMADEVRGYFGNQPWVTDELVAGMVQKQMENREAINKKYDQIMSERLHQAMKKRVTLVEMPIGKDEFQEKFKEWRERNDTNEEEE